MIGIINFTHSDPLYSNIRNKEAVIRESPAKILRMILDREIDGGMVSLVSLLQNDLSLCRGANIHSISTTLSTILVSNGKTMSRNMEIAVTSHTKTTEFYTEMVLKGLGINYRLIHTDKTYAEDLLSIADYALVIGDEALKVYGTRLRILLDTGFEFSRLYHLQPVYAAMAYPSDRPEPKGMKTVNDAVYPDSETVLECARAASERLGLNETLLRRYYTLVKYDFPDNLEKTVEFVKRHIGKK